MTGPFLYSMISFDMDHERGYMPDRNNIFITTSKHDNHVRASNVRVPGDTPLGLQPLSVFDNNSYQFFRTKITPKNCMNFLWPCERNQLLSTSQYLGVPAMPVPVSRMTSIPSSRWLAFYQINWQMQWFIVILRQLETDVDGTPRASHSLQFLNFIRVYNVILVDGT